MQKNKASIAVMILLLSIFCTRLASAAQLHVVDVNGLTNALNKVEDGKKIVFFFTSWCPYCKSIIDDILSNKNTFHEKIFFISLDKDYNKISNMVQHTNKDVDVYYMSSQEEIIGVFKKFKIKYNNSIPYISVLDEDNNLIKDNINVRQLYRYLR